MIPDDSAGAFVPTPVVCSIGAASMHGRVTPNWRNCVLILEFQPEYS